MGYQLFKMKAMGWVVIITFVISFNVTPAPLLWAEEPVSPPTGDDISTLEPTVPVTPEGEPTQTPLTEPITLSSDEWVQPESPLSPAESEVQENAEITVTVNGTTVRIYPYLGLNMEIGYYWQDEAGRIGVQAPLQRPEDVPIQRGSALFLLASSGSKIDGNNCASVSRFGKHFSDGDIDVVLRPSPRDGLLDVPLDVQEFAAGMTLWNIDANDRHRGLLMR